MSFLNLVIVGLFYLLSIVEGEEYLFDRYNKLSKIDAFVLIKSHWPISEFDAKKSLSHRFKLFSIKREFSNNLNLASCKPTSLNGNYNLIAKDIENLNQMSIEYYPESADLESYLKDSVELTDSTMLELDNRYDQYDSLQKLYLSELIHKINTDLNNSKKENIQILRNRSSMYSNFILFLMCLFILLFVIILTYTERQISLKKTSQIIDSNNQKIASLIQMVSHDLKAPFNSMQFLAKEATHDKGSPELNKIIVNQLKNLVDKSRTKISTLKQSTVGSTHRMEKMSKWTTLKPIIENSFVSINSKANQLESSSILNITFHDHLLVYANPNILSEVFQNLIDNAIKFSKPNQLPKIKIKAKEFKDRTVITFKDYGIGISQEKIENIFTREFSTSNTPNNLNIIGRKSGSGLGLFITKKMVEEFHHGTIDCISKENRFTKFTITLFYPPAS